MKKTNLLFIFVLLVGSLHAQNVVIEGYAFAANNQGYLNEVVVTAYTGDTPRGNAVSDLDGKFSMELPINMDYRFVASKGGFKEKEITETTKGATPGSKVYVKIPMDRSPGYIFEATLAEGKGGQVVEPTDAIRGATIEIYNNTLKKPELVLRQHEKHTFSHTFEKGNQYIVLIRKEGYYTKRIQANVDVNGCILCFEGLSNVQPGISDNLTAENSAGTLVANIDMRRIVIGEAIEISDIYYDYGKWSITSRAALELDKLAKLLKDNPSLNVELGAHTDCRDLQATNQVLSEKRAKSAVEYLINKGQVNPNRLSYKGYGESQLKLKECDCNKAKTPAQKCTEEQHAQNRRTEIKVLNINKIDEANQGSLASSMMEENMDAMLAELENSVFKVPEGGMPPPEVAADIAKSKPQTSTKTDTEEEWEKILRGEGEIVQVPAEYVPTPSADKPAATPPVRPTLGKGNFDKPEAPVTERPTVQAEETVTLPSTRNTRPASEETEVEEAPTPTRTIATAPTPPSPPKVSYPNPRTEAPAPKTDVVKETVVVQEQVVTSKPTLPTPRRTETIEEEAAADAIVTAPVPIIQPMSTPNATSYSSKEAIPLAPNYSGYKVQLVGSPSQLSADHEVFKEFAFVTLYVNNVGEYLYMIGDFRNKIQAETFLERNIIARFPEAKVANFLNGKPAQ